MKLASYLRHGQPAVGAVAGDRVLDLDAPGGMIGLLAGGLAEARRAVDAAAGRPDLWHPLAEVELLAPVPRPGKIVCVGLNYRSHLAEIGDPVPEFPILFLKPATSVTAHRRPVVLPHISTQVDYEGELAVVIGRRAKTVTESDALAHVAGYTCANDVSAHDIEFRTSQWTSGKMLDTFCPLGPVLATLDEFAHPTALALRTTLNGAVVQACGTADMVFGVAALVSYVSSLATLEPGDVILTGTPAGIGCNRRPPVFLRPGDVVEVSIDGIGTLSNPFVAEA